MSLDLLRSGVSADTLLLADPAPHPLLLAGANGEPTGAFVDPEVLYDDTYTGDQADIRTVDVYVPEGEGPFPLVIWTHGGGYVDRNPDKGYNVGQLMQAEGYVCGLIGYRLIEDEGSSAVPAGGQPTAFTAMAEMMLALAFLIANAETYRIDPARIVIMGHSSGGGMATRAAILAYWLGTIGVDRSAVKLCVPIDQDTGWNYERVVSRSRPATTGTTLDRFGVLRDDQPEPGYAPVGYTENSSIYPTGTALYDHPTVLYSDIEGRRHPQNLSVIEEIGPETPRHFVPYGTTRGRSAATAEFVAAMQAQGRPVRSEFYSLNHAQIKRFIGDRSTPEGARLTDDLLDEIADATRPVIKQV